MVASDSQSSDHLDYDHRFPPRHRPCDIDDVIARGGRIPPAPGHATPDPEVDALDPFSSKARLALSYTIEFLKVTLG